uniref:Uncharacterized protein n=1 Tax=Arundo donax TaxID=35708 RepID=A0A0A9BSH7_ARUDO
MSLSIILKRVNQGDSEAIVQGKKKKGVDGGYMLLKWMTTLQLR